MPLIRISRPARLGLLVVACILSGCGSTSPPTVPPAMPNEPAASHEELSQYYSPIIYQGAASDQDYITAVDLDGDWIGTNNWENQPTGDLSAHVYYSVIETESH